MFLYTMFTTKLLEYISDSWGNADYSTKINAKLLVLLLIMYNLIYIGRVWRNKGFLSSTVWIIPTVIAFQCEVDIVPIGFGIIFVIHWIINWLIERSNKCTSLSE